METNNYLFGILDAILIILVITLVVLLSPFVLAYLDSDKEIKDIQDVVSECVRKNVSDAGLCAVEMTSSFYKYNLDNLGKNLDFQTLMEEGGVCSSWSDYYSEVGDAMGYNTQNVIIQTSDNLYHEFSVWSNEEEYCVLDQVEVSCFEF